MPSQFLLFNYLRDRRKEGKKKMREREQVNFGKEKVAELFNVATCTV
jgi:hypothetical protein